MPSKKHLPNIQYILRCLGELSCLLIFILFSCKKVEKDIAFKIYHLKPNRVYIEEDTLNKAKGNWHKRRNDFFAIKNYDIANEQHKIKIDSFVVEYLKKDNFLIENKNSFWRLTFFKYGEGIDENTVHQYATDYTIHNLFSYKKEIAVVYIDNRFGYGNTSCRITPEKTEIRRRKIISDYFEDTDLDLNK